ncbi:type II toxin-antitoxin system HicA family toxin [Crocosphaera sp. XPORK-15E]|uniref:type II toxin-antitoxin system HicA family toxin n=1 Tax=Crocosphaera sp. XPORK-15E TaxID=3110247 RepID=UPI002B221627|nr:type II toxin-antitoxin system HicA family toxin [Crocosphaera sp. XPORK-15E]MEA5534097.1 type II toxin-antitoxin system HicA family toxin [Crocosphaera sp. XPORK-15E]
MPKLKRLSGSDVIKILAKFGFEIYSQKGSHIKLRRLTTERKETLTIPNHRQLDTGTCYSIFKQATQYIPESELYSYFYDS